MSILNKFDSIEITSQDKISQEDREFCNKQQFVYNKAYNCFTEVQKQFDTLHKDTYDICPHGKYDDGSCLKYNNYLQDLKENMEKMNERLTYNIYAYFKNTYSVELNEYKAAEEYKNKDRINVDMIIDRIIDELGGFSFEEVKTMQLKNNIKKHIWKDKMTIKKETLFLGKFLYWSMDARWDKDYECRNMDSFYNLLEAIRIFDTNKEIIMPNMGDSYYKKFMEIQEFTECNGDKINSIKLFKNGKVEIKFTSNQYAKKFATEWLGWTE